MGKITAIALWLAKSLTNSKDGPSGKKLAAFFVIMALVSPVILTWLYWAYRHSNWRLMEETLNSLLAFAAVALGLNTSEKIAEHFKTKKDESSPENTGAQPDADQLPQR